MLSTYKKSMTYAKNKTQLFNYLVRNFVVACEDPREKMTWGQETTRAKSILESLIKELEAAILPTNPLPLSVSFPTLI